MNCSTSCRMCCGTGGVIAGLALLAWFGVPAIVAVVSDIGFDFTTPSPLLLPVILGALGLIALGLWLGFRSHGRLEPLMIGILGAASTVIGMLTWVPVALMGFLVVMAAIVASQLYLRRADQAAGAR